MITLLAAVQAELGPLPGHPVGIGPLNAAIGAQSVLAGGSGAVVLIGTAGAYPGSGLSIGAILTSSHLGLSGGIAELGLGYQPIAPAVLEGEIKLLPGHPSAAVLTVPAITTDQELSLKRGQRWQLEHMEAYAVAEVCRRLGRPFVALLGVSNQVGPDAHAQWVEHHGAVELALQQALAVHL